MTHEVEPREGGPCYEIRVSGHLGGHWTRWFGDLTITHDDDSTTTLRGGVADQAALHGLLAKVRDLGLTLISVTTVEPPRPDPPERERSSPITRK